MLKLDLVTKMSKVLILSFLGFAKFSRRKGTIFGPSLVKEPKNSLPFHISQVTSKFKEKRSFITKKKKP
jgi:hypothetical protein